MSNLDEVLKLVNNVINIDKDRKLYTDHYTALKNAILNELKKDDVFKALYHGDYLQGSYRENLKVTEPNEFDMVVYLKLPENARSIIRQDPERHDWVFICLKDILNTIQPQKQHQQTYFKLVEWVNNEKYLLVDKLLSFLHSCMSKALNALNYQITFNKKTTKIRLQRCGPAFTIHVSDPKYSVDFVPGIYFSADQALIRGIKKQWTVIPKPIYGVPNQISFRTNYYDDEQDLTKDTCNLKNSLRMMKKFRDKNECMSSLKSFHIKTLFLVKLKKDPNYWKRRSVEYLLLEMFQLLEESLRIEYLPNYWYPEVNVYKDINKPLLQSMRGFVSKSLGILTKHTKEKPLTSKIHGLFLTVDEELNVFENLSIGTKSSLL